MKSDYSKVEHAIASSILVLKGEKLPTTLPSWLESEGITPGAEIVNAKDIGAESPDNKTDVLVELKGSNPLKLSVKKDNADYYGNWYGHVKIINTFGDNVFYKLTQAATNWANHIKKDKAWDNKPFVGVSINFGKRSGKTKLNFEDVFDKNDILTIARGKGHGDGAANALIVTTDGKINSVSTLIQSLQEITIENILGQLGNFYIIFRPVNPMTEGTNRAKNIYTRFVPYKKLDKPTIIKKMSDLNKLGTFKTVTPVLTNPKLTHNYVLNDLEKNYNIIIPRKGK